MACKVKLCLSYEHLAYILAMVDGECCGPFGMAFSRINLCMKNTLKNSYRSVTDTDMRIHSNVNDVFKWTGEELADYKKRAS
ncbi:riboflavin transporter,Solute carrier family 52,member [Trichinella pseudospiralis]